MNTEHQTLADVPFWMLVLLSMAGLSGEMLRASGSDLSLRQILQRVALRFLASGLLTEIDAATHERPLPLTTGRVVSIRVDRKQTNREPDGVTYQGSVTLRIITQH
ncbi:MAG: tail completion protein gp17 [Pseudomonas sp.]